jgi:hypothetical protein
MKPIVLPEIAKYVAPERQKLLERKITLYVPVAMPKKFFYFSDLSALIALSKYFSG